MPPSYSHFFLILGFTWFSSSISGIVIFKSDSRENEITQSLESDSKRKLIARKSIIFEDDNFSSDPYNYNYNNSIYDNEKNEDTKATKEGWNYFDTTKRWTPHEKTVSFQVLDDDGRYAHNPPQWPHDEYILQFPAQHGFGLKNVTQSHSSQLNQPNQYETGDRFNDQNESTKNYAWNNVPNRRPPKSIFIGPGFYDSNNNAYPGFTHQAITDSAVASVVTNADSNSQNGDGQVPNAVSESSTNSKLFPGGYNPYDYYKRKRLRLKIHPGLIAAPIAGFAAYKAVSAIASKPLMFEFGWVGNRPEIGWGWGQPVVRPPYYPPPIYPLPNHPYPQPPILQPVHGPEGFGQGPRYPILRPKKKPETTKSTSWWPFAALTPRIRSMLNRKDDKEEKEEKEHEDTTTTKDYYYNQY